MTSTRLRLLLHYSLLTYDLFIIIYYIIIHYLLYYIKSDDPYNHLIQRPWFTKPMKADRFSRFFDVLTRLRINFRLGFRMLSDKFKYHTVNLVKIKIRY